MSRDIKVGSNGGKGAVITTKQPITNADGVVLTFSSDEEFLDFYNQIGNFIDAQKPAKQVADNSLKLENLKEKHAGYHIGDPYGRSINDNDIQWLLDQANKYQVISNEWTQFGDATITDFLTICTMVIGVVDKSKAI